MVCYLAGMTTYLCEHNLMDYIESYGVKWRMSCCGDLIWSSMLQDMVPITKESLWEISRQLLEIAFEIFMKFDIWSGPSNVCFAAKLQVWFYGGAQPHQGTCLGKVLTHTNNKISRKFAINYEIRFLVGKQSSSSRRYDNEICICPKRLNHSGIPTIINIFMLKFLKIHTDSSLDWVPEECRWRFSIE